MKNKKLIFLATLIILILSLLYFIFNTKNEDYNPQITASEFTSNITNKYFNLPIGKKMIYEAHTEEGLERNEIEILAEKKRVMGVETIIYWDRVWLNDDLIEDTKDYLAQDKEGNVWYFGEDVNNYENGVLVDHKGSWTAGVNGAKAGIWIKSAPTVGDSYKQEFLKGEAEDISEIISVNENIILRNKTYKDCVKVLDWTPLDSEAREHKYYCPEVGAMVKEFNIIKNESSELIEILMP